jgi:hypothetical protein
MVLTSSRRTPRPRPTRNLGYPIYTPRVKGGKAAGPLLPPLRASLGNRASPAHATCGLPPKHPPAQACCQQPIKTCVHRSAKAKDGVGQTAGGMS